jgi:hypothetical protein
LIQYHLQGQNLRKIKQGFDEKNKDNVRKRSGERNNERNKKETFSIFTIPEGL